MPCSPATRSSPSRGRRSGSAARPARQGQGRDPHRHGGTDEKAAKATALGADHVINYTEVDDLGAAVRELTGGTGVHVVYDGVGTSTFRRLPRRLRPRGTLVLFGAASGQVPPFDIQRLNAGGSLFLTRPALANYIATRDELEWRAAEILGVLADADVG